MSAAYERLQALKAEKTPEPTEPMASPPMGTENVSVGPSPFDKLQALKKEEANQPIEEKYYSEVKQEEQRLKDTLGEIPFSIGFGDLKYTADETTWADIIGEDGVAFLVGAGHGMSDTYRGIKQIFGMDVEEEKQNELAMKQLYASPEYGTEAMVGLVGGAITDPAGLVMGGPLGVAATKIQKIKTLGNMSKYGLAGSIAGGVQVGTGYVDDESGISRPVLIGLGVVGGGVVGTVGGKLANKAAAQEVTKHFDNIRFLEGEVARRVESGLTLNDAITSVTKDMPVLKADVDAAIKATGAQPDFVTAIRNAPINKATETGIVPVDSTPRNLRTIGNGVDKALGVISTRVRNLNERVAGKLRWYDGAVAARPEKYRKMRDDFASMFKTSTSRRSGKNAFTFSDKEVIDLNRMLNKGDFEGVKSFLKFRRGDEAVKSFEKSLKVYDEIGEELVKYGLLPKEKLVDNYWHIFIPRENMDEFMDLMKVSQPDIANQWVERLAKLNESSLRKNGHVLSEFQEGLAFQKFILGGADADDISVIGFLKNRKVKNWSDDMLKLQADPIKAMDNYMHSAVQEIEKAKFFGPDIYNLGYKGTTDGVFDLGKALDGYEANFMKGMDPNNQKELKELLRLRFGNAMVGANTATQVYKAAVNITLLGNVISALTQLGDVGVSMYKNGIRNTLSSALDVVNERVTGKANRITIEDIGLEQRFQEFEDINKPMLGKIQDTIFKWSGFSEVDRLGKESFMNSTLNNMTKMVQEPTSPAYKRWVKKNQQFLGGDMQGVLDGFRRYAKTGKKEDLGDDAMSYVFSELANTQPISRSELPEFYHKSNIGKTIYTLKSFMLKQLDILRNDGWNMIKQGKANNDTAMMAEGAKNIVRYLGIVGSTNVAAIHLKDLVSGKVDLENMLPEEVGAHLAVSAFNNVMLANIKTFGFDPYTVDRLMAPGGLEETAKSLVLPPFPPVVTEGWSLMIEGQLTEAEKKRLVGYFPLIGRVFNQRIFQEQRDRFDMGEEAIDRFESEEITDRFSGEEVSRFAEGGVVTDNPVLNNEPPLTAAMEQTPATPAPVMPAQTASQPVQGEIEPSPTPDQPEESVEEMQARMTAPEEGKEGMTHLPPKEMGEKGKAAMEAIENFPEEAYNWLTEDVAEWVKQDIAKIPDTIYQVIPSFIPGYDLGKAIEAGDPTEIMIQAAMEAAGPIGDKAKVMAAGITVALRPATSYSRDLVKKLKGWKEMMAKNPDDPKAAYNAYRIYLDKHNNTLQYAIPIEQFDFSPPGTNPKKIGNVVSGGNWEEVLELSPKFRDIDIKMDDLGDGYFGKYTPNTNTITLNKNLNIDDQKATLVHEFEHGVQRWHQLSTGTNAEMYDILLPPEEASVMKLWAEQRKRLKNDLDVAEKNGDFFRQDMYRNELNKLDNEMKPLKDRAYENYTLKKGEAEAEWAAKVYMQNANFTAGRKIYPKVPVFSKEDEMLLLKNKLPDVSQEGMAVGKIWTDKPF